MKELLANFKREQQEELERILKYWMTHTIDAENGGFFGRIDNENVVYATAPKGSVLNSRILWTFSSAYNFTGDKKYRQVADRAYHYLVDHFTDKEFGGLYWTVDYKGQPLDTKNQIYALAFAAYAFSEYYRSSGMEEVKERAIDLYGKIEAHSYDRNKGGYIEALTRDWKEINDLRLSSKDANEKKSMNTHLHVLEAYTNLYRIWPNAALKKKLEDLIVLFLDHIIDPVTNHLILFFDEDWNRRSDIISYGHDIEAAWLLQEAAEVIEQEELLHKVKQRSLLVAQAASKGLDKDGGLWYEYDLPNQHLVKEKHWWPQAEAMVGYLNAWQISGNNIFLENSLNSWSFIKNYMLDKKKGEWYWGVKEDYSIMETEDKVGLWKCPYHNGRACIEVINRISSFISSN